MQTIHDGFQHEQPDYWLNFGNPWEIERLNIAYTIKFYGHVSVQEEGGRQTFRWNPGESVSSCLFEHARNDLTNCRYLDPTGCTIHADAASSCQWLDCQTLQLTSLSATLMHRKTIFGHTGFTLYSHVMVLTVCSQVQVTAVAYDNPIPGFHTNNTINLRLWAAKPDREFDLEAFNTGDYVQVTTKSICCSCNSSNSSTKATLN